MPSSWNEIKDRTLAFSKEWKDERAERAEAQSFWKGFFDVFGVKRRRVAVYEKAVAGKPQSPEAAAAALAVASADPVAWVWANRVAAVSAAWVVRADVAAQTDRRHAGAYSFCIYACAYVCAFLYRDVSIRRRPCLCVPGVSPRHRGGCHRRLTVRPRRARP
jgi:hypothetical protein